MKFNIDNKKLEKFTEIFSCKSESNILSEFFYLIASLYSSQNDFEILSVLRNLKIIGIFTRLANRDKKKRYLKFIPYAWKLIEDRIDNNDIFRDLKKKLEDNFPKKIRIKK